MLNPYLPDWIREASTVPTKAQLLFDEITEEQLNQKPAADQWSIGELLDHIIVSNEQYFPVLERIACGMHKNPFLGRFKEVYAFFGDSMLRAVDPNTTKKYKTVRKFQPVKRTFTLQKLEEFEHHQQQLIDYARATDFVDHTQVVIASPASPIIVYSLEYAFKIILSHEFRHINQAMKLKEPLGPNQLMGEPE